MFFIKQYDVSKSGSTTYVELSSDTEFRILGRIRIKTLIKTGYSVDC